MQEHSDNVGSGKDEIYIIFHQKDMGNLIGQEGYKKSNIQVVHVYQHKNKKELEKTSNADNRTYHPSRRTLDKIAMYVISCAEFCFSIFKVSVWV
jgi:hypothetical protein